MVLSESVVLSEQFFLLRTSLLVTNSKAHMPSGEESRRQHFDNYGKIMYFLSMYYSVFQEFHEHC